MIEKYFIKIDLDSIKVNENAGSTTSTYLTTQEIEFDFIGNCENFNLIKKLEKEKVCIITQLTYFESDDKVINCSGILYDPNKIREFKSIEYVNIGYNQNYIKLQHLPVPKYSFKYEDPEIICSECGEKFNFSELLSLDNDNDWYYESTETMCPKCGEWHCCEIEYEKIENALIKNKL